MKAARTFVQVSRRFYRPEQSHCPVCQRRLRRAVTLSERTGVTLKEGIKMVPAGYPRADPHCGGAPRTYRRVAGGGRALAWVCYWFDIVVLVVPVRLGG